MKVLFALLAGLFTYFLSSCSNLESNNVAGPQESKRIEPTKPIYYFVAIDMTKCTTWATRMDPTETYVVTPCVEKKRSVVLSEIEEAYNVLSEDDRYKLMDWLERKHEGEPGDVEIHDRQVYTFDSYVEASNKRKELKSNN